MDSITVSIVSHGHGTMIFQLLDQLSKYASYITRVVITYNIKEEKVVSDSMYPFEVVKIQNTQPLGFGENHNQAFKFCESDYFCVMNPDIYIESDPFVVLLSCMKDSLISIVAPSIVNFEHKQEDSARYFPTPFGILKKLLSDYKGKFPSEENMKIIFPDWIAGMFLLFPSNIYRELSGFDKGYFLYYEDVDICARSWRLGYKVALCTEVSVIHDARRDSHKNLKFLRWHLSSALRFFVKHLFRFPEKIF